MALTVCLVYLVCFIYLFFKYLKVKEVPMSLKMQSEIVSFNCTGHEYVIILLVTTGIMGLLPLLALHLFLAEVICVLIIRNAKKSPIFSLPIKLFFVFIAWTVIGLFYTPNISYGIRMILKYLYPPLIALAASAVVDNVVVFLKTGVWSRFLAFISFFASKYIPMNGIIFAGVFWNTAALATNYIVWTIFSLSLYNIGVDKKKNLLWTAFFIMPCLLWVYRTNIFGTSVALAAFFFIKYRIKSLPLIFGMAVLAVCALFYIPSVKSKMYFRPDEVTINDFLTGNVDENNINTSGRKLGWEYVEDSYYKGHELTGSGTGRVQTFFYAEAEGWQRGGQLHNDLLVLLCDNGIIGLILFGGSYLAILLHCTYIYRKTENDWVRMCVVTAGAPLLGMLVTLYSDNTVSYSLATLGYPWAFYGMALGIYNHEKKNIEQYDDSETEHKELCKTC